jgi:hypothetical protein
LTLNNCCFSSVEKPMNTPSSLENDGFVGADPIVHTGYAAIMVMAREIPAQATP